MLCSTILVKFDNHIHATNEPCTEKLKKTSVEFQRLNTQANLSISLYLHYSFLFMFLLFSFSFFFFFREKFFCRNSTICFARAPNRQESKQEVKTRTVFKGLSKNQYSAVISGRTVFSRFVPNPLDDSYPANYETKC